jgi:hypothetical protein
MFAAAGRGDDLPKRSSIIISIYIALHTTGDDRQSTSMIRDQACDHGGRGADNSFARRVFLRPGTMPHSGGRIQGGDDNLGGSQIPAAGPRIRQPFRLTKETRA